MAIIAVLTNLPDSESAFNLARDLLRQCYTRLEQAIRERHPHAIPEIPVFESSLPEYLGWVGQEVQG